MNGASIWNPGSDPTISVNANNSYVQQIFSGADGVVSGGNTVFSLSAFTYALDTGSLDVYINGVYQRIDIDFVELTINTVGIVGSSILEPTDIVIIKGLIGSSITSGTTPVQSSEIGYIPPGLGALATTVELRLDEVIYSTDYITVAAATVAGYGKILSLASGVTANISVPGDFADLSSALLAINKWVIPTDSYVQINLSGVITSTSRTVLNHPYGEQIKLVGESVITTTASAIGAVTGASGAWAMPVTVASSAGMAVGGYLTIKNVVGTGRHKLYSGGHKISSIVGNVVTVTNTAKNAAWPAATFTSADIVCIKTVLQYNNCDGFEVFSNIGSVDKLVIAGNKNATRIGVLTQRASEAGKSNGHIYFGPNCIITSFGDGGIYAQYGGTVDAQYMCVSDCLIYNVHAQQNGAVMFNDGISVGCAEAGISASSAACTSAERAISVGHGTHGAYAFGGGAVLLRDGFAWANIGDGVRTAYNGIVRADNLDLRYNGGNGLFSVGAAMVIPTGICNSNTGVGVYAEGGANIYCSGLTSTGNGSYGFYADGACIDSPSGIASTNALAGFACVNGGVILASGANGSGNTGPAFSASTSGHIRATTATADSVTVSSNASIDITGISGAPTVTTNPEGVIIDAVIKRGRINIDTASAAYLRFAKGGVLKGFVGIDDGSSLIAGAASGDYIIRAEQAAFYQASLHTFNAGDISIALAGKGLRVKTGANARLGSVNLVAGSIAVANTSVTSNTKVFISRENSGGTLGDLSVGLTVGVGFTITSTSPIDVSTINWFLIEAT